MEVYVDNYEGRYMQLKLLKFNKATLQMVKGITERL